MLMAVAGALLAAIISGCGGTGAGSTANRGSSSGGTTTVTGGSSGSDGPIQADMCRLLSPAEAGQAINVSTTQAAPDPASGGCTFSAHQAKGKSLGAVNLYSTNTAICGLLRESTQLPTYDRTKTIDQAGEYKPDTSTVPSPSYSVATSKGCFILSVLAYNGYQTPEQTLRGLATMVANRIESGQLLQSPPSPTTTTVPCPTTKTSFSSPGSASAAVLIANMLPALQHGCGTTTTM
jgi:hypothetical protein